MASVEWCRAPLFARSNTGVGAYALVSHILRGLTRHFFILIIMACKTTMCSSAFAFAFFDFTARLSAKTRCFDFENEKWTVRGMCWGLALFSHRLNFEHSIIFFVFLCWWRERNQCQTNQSAIHELLMFIPQKREIASDLIVLRLKSDYTHKNPSSLKINIAHSAEYSEQHVCLYLFFFLRQHFDENKQIAWKHFDSVTKHLLCWHITRARARAGSCLFCLSSFPTEDSRRAVFVGGVFFAI